MALDLQACGTVAEAKALAARALAGERGRRPVFDRAITETAERGLESVREREQLRSLAIRDPLTGLYNRRFMHPVRPCMTERPAHHTMPERTAQTAACVRSRTESFRRMFCTCSLTVSTLIARASAISSLDRP